MLRNGKICYVEIESIGADAPEITARFRDPAGNLIGLDQQPAESRSNVGRNG